MRELIKSMTGFSLSMAVFGVEQLRSVIQKPDDETETRSDHLRGSLDTVSEAAGQRFGERAQRLYDAGDRFQREMIDMAFDIVKPSKSKQQADSDEKKAD